MNAKILLLDSLDEGGTTYRKKLKSCRAEFSEEAVHDLRTSIRRLLAILDVTAFVTSGSRSEKVADELKDQLDRFNDLRDIQVMLERVSEDVNTLPELEPFENDLAKREKRQEGKEAKHVANLKPGGIRKQLLKIRGAVEDLSADELEGKLPQAGDEAYLRVIQRYTEIDRTQLVTIHHLRVAFKNFRYMVEAIYPCLPDFPEAQLEQMHDYQTQMGDIHDLQVLLETLTEFAEDDDSIDPEPIRLFYERALDETLARFLKNKDEVLAFWRPTPLAAFPWQGEPAKKEEYA